MDSARIESSGRREGQDRQSRSPERQNQPMISQEREAHYLRYSRSVSRDSPSSSDTSHTTASEIGQQGDQDHQQHDREQERQSNILRRMLGCVLPYIWSCCLENSMSNVANHRYQPYPHLGISHMQSHLLHWESAYQPLWHEPESEFPWQRQEMERQEMERQEMERQEMERQEMERQERRGKLLGVDLSKVKEKEWIEFATNLINEHGNLYSDGENEKDKKDTRLLGDILVQGGISKHVTYKERGGELYKNLKKWVRDEWDNRNKINQD